ncbi:MAG TPA: hypothetical protein PKD91_01745, partial [Bacteroidia bacterium]|nr:hypothetical protein [Bacteroidia bacterium]
MKKNPVKYYFLILLLLSNYTVVKAQGKLLTMDDAVLSARRGLVPAKADQLQWIGNTGEFAYVNKDSGVDILVTGTPDGKSFVEIFSISNFNKALGENGLDSVTSFPALTWTDKNRFTFESKGALTEYNHQTGKFVKLLDATDEGAERKDYNKATNTVAYTIENNLWILNASGKKQIT